MELLYLAKKEMIYNEKYSRSQLGHIFKHDPGKKDQMAII